MSSAVGFFICYILVGNMKKLIQLSFNQMKNQGNVINDVSLISFPIVRETIFFFDIQLWLFLFDCSSNFPFSHYCW